MRLFISKSEREAEAQIAIDMGRASVKDYVKNCRSAGDRYLTMARKAMVLKQAKQAEGYIVNYLEYNRQADKWEAFLLKIDDVMLRGKAMSAMGALMEGVSSVCKSIGRGISSVDIKRTMVDLKLASAKVDVAEQQMGKMMDGIDVNVSGDMMDIDLDHLSEEMVEEVSQISKGIRCEIDAELTKPETKQGKTRVPNGESIDGLISDLERFRQNK